MTDNDYLRSLQAWRLALDAEIRRDRGALALSGLFWLQDGFNTVGSSPDCSICLPKPVPRLLGAFERDGSRVSFHADVGQNVEIEGSSVQVQSGLRFEDEVGASLIRSGDLEMALTRHADRVGVRVWNSARARDFPPRRWFEADERYLIRATYTAYPVPARIKMTNALGEIQDGFAQGYVAFKLGGRSHNIDAAETEGGRLFLQFRDQTNGVLTYPGGRYLDTDPVPEDGRVSLDFNRAYNPPSAFTTFTTCTLPARDSMLACAIEAGEQYEPSPPDRG